MTLYVITLPYSEDRETLDGNIIYQVDDFDSVEQATECWVNFLSQTNEAYADKLGFVHEILDGKNQVLGIYCNNEDDVRESLKALCTQYELSDKVRDSVEKAYIDFGNDKEQEEREL
jgi:hypothetical protein